VLRTPATLEANFQNFGSQDLGRWGGMVRAQFFGLTGLGDRTLLSAFSTLDFDEQQTLQIAHDFLIGGSGLGLGGQFTYAWAQPALGDTDIDLESVTKYATLELGYPFVRSAETTLRGSLGFDFIDQDVDFNELPLSKDHLRVLFARMSADLTDTNYQGGRYSFSEPHWRLTGTLEFRHGLDIFGASENCSDDPQACLDGDETPPSRLEGDSTAGIVRGGVLGEFRPMRHFTLAAGMRGQYSSRPLLSFEEFAGGNYTVGRGYDPGAILGDRGLGFQAEIRVGSTIPATTTSFAFEPFVFIDQAIAWNEDVFGGPFPRQELTSAGGGVRASLGGQFLLDLTFAAPLDKVFGEKPDPRLLISFTSHLLPWTM
jgi:hemolysin activation/secretion protein